MASREKKLTRPLLEVAWLFLKLGTIAFGGPAAHIAMMQNEVVRRRQWLTEAEFLDLLGATNLIPGPNSTEMAIHIGHRRAGMAGLWVAGCCFILPAMSIVTAFAWAYVRFGQVPPVGAVLYGIKPVIIAIVAQALWGMGRSALKTTTLAILAAAVVALAGVGVHELVLLFGAGVVMLVMRGVVSGGKDTALRFFLLPPLKPFAAAALPVAAMTTAVTPFGLWPIFLFFLKVGSVLYGSGYVLLAFLRSGLVDRYGWLTENQLLDAVAVGQVTPGPVFTTATFIGYLLGGIPGAGLATVGIFLPAFIFVAVSGPLIPRIRQSPGAGAFLDGVNAASLALMALVTWHLARSALVDWLTLALVLGAAALLLLTRLNSVWLIIGGAGAGLIKAWLL